MDRRRETPGRRPSILDRPFFRASRRDFTKAPLVLQNENIGSRQSNAQNKNPIYKHAGSRTTTNPANWQPYCTKIPVSSIPMSPLLPSIASYDHYSSQKSRDINSSGGRQPSSQQPSITILKPRIPGAPSSLHRLNPAKSHTEIPKRHPSPFPLSKIRALKSTYDTLNPDKGRDYLDQIRLSRAISFHSHLQGTLGNMLTLSELPFANEEDIFSAQALCIDNKVSRDDRMAERLTQWDDMRPETPVRSTQPQRTESTPYIVRCGEQGSDLPILVRWTNTEGDRYEIYHEHGAMPREVRYLLLEIRGAPFGDEGRDWEVDADGRVWVRERPHRYNRWGRWWILQSSEHGRTAR